MIYIFPTEFEAAPFKECCPRTSVIISGVGLAETAATMARYAIMLKGPFVLAGIAGSYDLDDVALGEVVEVEQETIMALPERFRKTYYCENIFGLRGVTSNSVNSNGESHSMQIENMEGASFMSVCQAYNVEYHEIRAISNRVGDPFEEWRIGEALQNLTSELTKIYNIHG